MFLDVKTMKAMQSWTRLNAAYAKMSMSAGEVIMRRSIMMAQGAMSAPEAAKMLLEKPVAFAAAAEKAMTAAARGAHPTSIAEAALRPIGARARANARRLRK